VEHRLLERREALGGAWQDRWDSFYPYTPNFSFLLPELTYDGPEPDAFLPQDEVIGLFRNYAARIAAPVQLGAEVTRGSAANGGLAVETTHGRWQVRNVVLANGAFQLPRIRVLPRELLRRVRDRRGGVHAAPPAEHGDHFYPWSKGGSTSLENFVTAPTSTC
jgi:putative flavoprotein involved in K+ transport